MSDVAVLHLREGAVFHGRYRVVRCIKAGGMGAVYEVIHIETRRRRALKIMLPSLVTDAEMRARFKLETTITAEVDSEHLVETFDAGVDRETGAPYLVMELLKGEEVADLLKRRGRLPPAEALVLLGQAARALDRTHDADIVHRDLKPANLFVTRRDDGSPRLKVLDFGIAKLRAQSDQSARTTRSLGTPMYMSPEQIRGDGTIDHRADLYALGQIAYTLLVGEAYWAAEARDSSSVYPILVKVMEGTEEPASARARTRGVTLPAGFDAWFAKATAFAPSDRFDSASRLVEELAAALGDGPPEASTAEASTAEASTAETSTAEASTAETSGEPPEAPGKKTETEPVQRTIPLAPRRNRALASIGGAVAAGVLAALGVLSFMRVQDAPGPADAGVRPERTASAQPALSEPSAPAPSSAPPPTPTAKGSASASATARAPAAPSAVARPRGKKLPAGVETEP